MFFDILAVENIQRTMEGVPLIRPSRKFLAKPRQAMASLPLSKAVYLMKAVNEWTASSASNKTIREFIMLESLVAYQASLLYGHLRWLVSPSAPYPVSQ